MADLNEFRIQVRADYPTAGSWEVQLLACPIPDLIGPKGKSQPTLTRRQLRHLRNRNDWPNHGALAQIGSAVWSSVMTPDLAAAFKACLVRSREQGKGLQITAVTLGSEQRDDNSLSLDAPVRLAELPFEALYTEEQGFLGTDSTTPICRGLQAASDRTPKQARLPLRVLVAVATPSDKPEASAEKEVRAIHSALDSLSGVKLQICERPTRDELANSLKECDIFHFIGHGGFDPVGSDPTSQAYITLIREDSNASDWLTAYDLANLLHNTDVQLVVFTSCASAAPTPDEEPYSVGAFDGMAQRLLTGPSGVSAAVAMQFDMEEKAAVTFSQAFYQHLLEPDTTLTGVVTFARKQVSIKMGIAHRAWVTPTVYCRCLDGRVFELVDPQESAKVPLELSAVQRKKLRDALLSCRYMKRPEPRRQIMSDLQKDFKEISFDSSPNAAIEVAGVIDNCLDFGGATCIEAFLKILEGYEGSEANTMKAVWTVWRERAA